MEQNNFLHLIFHKQERRCIHLLEILILLGVILGVVILAPLFRGGKQLEGQLEDALEFGVNKAQVEKPLTKREERLKALEIQLIRASFPLSPQEFTRFRLISTVIVFLVFALLAKNFVLGVAFSAMVFMLPSIYLKFAIGKKKQVFESQIPIALSLIRNSVDAGFSFMQAIEVVATEMDAPISEEFSRVLHEASVGKDIEVALTNMNERILSDELKLVVVAVLIQRQVGGNLGEILEIILETIKDRIQIKGEIRTLTSQGRMSAMIICGLPVVLGIIMYFINPTYMGPLVTTTMGHAMLGVAAFMIFIGAFLINKIIQIDF